MSIICFAASYTVALILELSRVLFRSGIRGAVMLGFAGAGLLAHSAFLYYRADRAVRDGLSPLSSEFDWYLIAAWLLVVVYLYLVRYHPRTAFGCFLLPLVLVLIAATRFADPVRFGPGPASRAWGIVHGASIVLATVAVLIGFVAGLMYLGQVRRLKLKRPPRRGLQLPSLEWLERANGRAIVVSVIMMGVGVLSGMILNRINDRADAAPLAWYDPLVLSTQLMFGWLLLSVVLGAIYKPARRGRKVAYLTLASFVFLVIALTAGWFLDTRHWGTEEEPEGRRQKAESRTRSTGAAGAAYQSHGTPSVGFGSQNHTPPTAHRPLPTAYCLLPTAHRLHVEI